MTFNIRRDSSQFYILRCTHIKEKWVHTAPDYAIVQKKQQTIIMRKKVSDMSKKKRKFALLLSMM